LFGDPGSETVTGPIFVPVLALDSGLSVVFCSKQGSVEVLHIYSETCLSALESGPAPDPSWGVLPSS